MSRPDYERIGAESIGLDAKLERDWQREPGSRDRRARSRSIRLRCPTCRCPVYVPRDSDRERVDCNTCEAKLVTRRALAGEVSLIVREAP